MQPVVTKQNKQQYGTKITGKEERKNGDYKCVKTFGTKIIGKEERKNGDYKCVKTFSGLTSSPSPLNTITQ